jgi:hypothetical protein
MPNDHGLQLSGIRARRMEAANEKLVKASGLGRRGRACSKRPSLRESRKALNSRSPTAECDVLRILSSARLCIFTRSHRFTSAKRPSMLLKIFRKSATEIRPRIEEDSALAEEHARRISAIEFRPSKGFLKDQQQPKRSAVRIQRSA